MTCGNILEAGMAGKTTATEVVPGEELSPTAVHPVGEIAAFSG